MSEHGETERATADADSANGEPEALTSDDHRTGEQQARENTENDPPA